MTGRARTIDDVAAPYENFLVPMPSPASDVCRTCHSSVYGGYPRCFPCNDARRILGDLVADAVASVALAPNNEQLARTLHAYKNENLARAVRQPLINGLAAVLFKWLSLHENCLAAGAGLAGGQFDTVTSVPSSGARTAPHPLQTVLTGVVVGSKDRYADLLAVNRSDLGSRDIAGDRFVATRKVTGSVLVVDDSWVTGAKPQAAAAAVKAAGASTVAVLTIGRWLNDYKDNVTWLKEKRKPGWSWSTCCLH